MGSADEAPRRSSVAQVVESLGLGRGQIYVMLLGAAGPFMLSYVQNVLAISISRSDHVKATFTAGMWSLVEAMAVIGTAFGAIVGGYLGDFIGRRCPILLCYAVTTVFALAGAFVPSAWAVVLIRVGFGFGIGLGRTPAIAQLSEITPQKHRMLMLCASESVGQRCAVLFIILSEYNFAGWHALCFLSAIPPAALLITGTSLLPESPVFLATCGRIRDGSAGFDQLRTWNSCSDQDIDYVPPGPRSKRDREWHFFVPFSQPYLLTTLALITAALLMEISQYGAIASMEFGLAGEYTNLPGLHPYLPSTAIRYQLSDRMVDSMGCWLPFLICLFFSRKVALVCGISVLTTCAIVLAYSASGWILQDSFIGRWSIMLRDSGLLFGYDMTSTVLYQIAVEIYPTTSSSTSGATIFVCAQVGAFLIALVSNSMLSATDIINAWYVLYCATAFMGILVLFSVIAAPLIDASTPCQVASDPELCMVLPETTSGPSSYQSLGKNCEHACN